MTFNGALAGLVAITAGTDTVSPLAAFIIGIISGFVVVYGCEFLEKKAKIDDPVGAIAVHGFNGALGTIMVGIFSFNEGIAGAIKGTVSFAEAFNFLGVQALGVVAVALWVGVTMTVFFHIIKKTVGLRVSAEEEIGGLDFSEHNLATAYSGFILNNEGDIDKLDLIEYHPSSTVPAQMKHEVRQDSEDELQPKMTLVSIILKKPKFEALKYALNRIGVTGMTVTEVMGCGTQNGHTETYRGAPLDITLVPKLKVDVVISAVPVEKVIEAAKPFLIPYVR
jgi:Amt family ammonium transporter